MFVKLLQGAFRLSHRNWDATQSLNIQECIKTLSNIGKQPSLVIQYFNVYVMYYCNSYICHCQIVDCDILYGLLKYSFIFVLWICFNIVHVT